MREPRSPGNSSSERHLTTRPSLVTVGDQSSVSASLVSSVVAEWRASYRIHPAANAELAVADVDALVEAVLAGVVSDADPPTGVDVLLTSITAPNSNALAAMTAALSCLRTTVNSRIRTAEVGHDAHVAYARLDRCIDSLMLSAVRAVTAELETLVLTDAMTGLWNRRAFTADLPVQLALATELDQSLCVVAVDMVGLKALNDTAGHSAGDESIRRLAAAMMAAVTDQHRAYRVGGDEFALLLRGAHLPDAEDLVRRMESHDSPPFTWGACCAPDDGVDALALWEMADRRLVERRGPYHRRSGGRRATD